MPSVGKTVLSLFIPALCLSLTMGAAKADNSSKTSPEPPSKASVNAYANTYDNDDFRGVWVATVSNIDYPSEPTTDPELLKAEAIKILDNAAFMGLNAVILQVRPTADSFFPSKYFPWSGYLSGRQGLAPDNGFDPLEFWVAEAHERGLELHAWINPYRITKKAYGEPNPDLASLDPSHPARKNPGWTVRFSDGNLYFNPGIPEVRKLITDSVLEIIRNYAVDGIHMDDYFYPGKNFNDKATYEKYRASAKQDIESWRRENVNMLVRDLSEAIRNETRVVRFGVSPFGIWANKSSNALGSGTAGLQSYYDHYADTRKWVKEGLLDYIAPQLYWNIGYPAADYEKLSSWWTETVRDTGVDLYIGQAAYRTANPDPSSPWHGIAEIEKQLEMNVQNPAIKGSIFFSYNSLENNPSLMAAIRTYYGLKDGVAAEIPATVTVTRPSEDIRTTLDKFYLNGASDPGKPLYINGKPVENRSKQGFYGVLVPLAAGENLFILSQGTSCVTRVIYRDIPSPKPMDAADIPASSVFPQAQEYRMPGEKITLSCQAPAGSKVTVEISGKSYAMNPVSGNSAADSNDTAVYPATYTYTYTIPAFTGAPRNIDLGQPIYTMNYKGQVKTRKAPGSIGVIMEGSPYYASVSKSVIETYSTPSSVNGAAYELYSGMVDHVTGMTGDYVRLAIGQWVKKANVKIYTDKEAPAPVISKAEYITGERWDRLKLDTSSPATAISGFDGDRLKLTLSNVSSPVFPVLPKNSLFSSVRTEKDGAKVVYTLSLKKNVRIEGYYIQKTTAGIVLNIKRRIRIKEGQKPLSGITVLLDAGHGGSETGAIGPLGLEYAEKAINLDIALKLQTELQKLGAKVLMTRTTDTTVSLTARLNLSRDVKPDIFISLHANSMEDNVDISKVEGFSVFYREPLAKTLSETIYDHVVSSLNRNKHGVHVRNFYVTRGTWAPSILLETGFVPNPEEFEWLIDENEQSRLAQCLAEAVVAYFTK